MPQILKRAAEIIEELSAPAPNPVNNSVGSGVSQFRPERSQSSPSQHDLPASTASNSAEPSPVQPGTPSGPDHTEPYGRARQSKPPAATETWANHTKDLTELTQASRDLLEVKFVQDVVRH